MKIFRVGGWGLGLFCILLSSAVAQAATPHPLDPLTSSEVKETLDILKKENLVGDKTMFPYLLLKEPPKSEVLAYQSGKPFSRRAFTVLYERDTGKTSEVIVDLRAHKVESNQVKQGVHPCVMISEFDAVPPIVKADPRFAEAMKRRGITNLDDVAVDTWAYGTPDSEHSQKVRLLRAVAYYKGKHKNFYAKPIEGFMAVVNMNERKVEKIVDSGLYPIPPEASDLDESTFGKPQQRPQASEDLSARRSRAIKSTATKFNGRTGAFITRCIRAKASYCITSVIMITDVGDRCFTALRFRT